MTASPMPRAGLLGRLRALLPDFRDLHVYGGGLLAGYGLWSWHHWLGYAAGGALLVALGLRKGAA